MDEATKYVKRLRKLVKDNKPLWYRMDRAGVASYRYLKNFAAGGYENPGIHTLAGIEKYLSEQEAA